MENSQFPVGAISGFGIKDPTVFQTNRSHGRQPSNAATGAFPQVSKVNILTLSHKYPRCQRKQRHTPRLAGQVEIELRRSPEQTWCRRSRSRFHPAGSSRHVKSPQRINAHHIKFFIVRQCFPLKLFYITGFAVQNAHSFPDQWKIPAGFANDFVKSNRST